VRQVAKRNGQLMALSIIGTMIVVTLACLALRFAANGPTP
jgi:hypothetical protein